MSCRRSLAYFAPSRARARGGGGNGTTAPRRAGLVTDQLMTTTTMTMTMTPIADSVVTATVTRTH